MAGVLRLFCINDGGSESGSRHWRRSKSKHRSGQRGKDLGGCDYYKVQRFSNKQRNNTVQPCFDYPHTIQQLIVVQRQRDVPVYKATYKATSLSLQERSTSKSSVSPQNLFRITCLKTDRARRKHLSARLHIVPEVPERVPPASLGAPIVTRIRNKTQMQLSVLHTQ